MAGGASLKADCPDLSIWKSGGNGRNVGEAAVAKWAGRWQAHLMQIATFNTSADDLLAAYRLNLKAKLRAKRAQRNFLVGGLAVGVLCAAAAWIWPFAPLLIAAAIGVAYWMLFLTAVFGAAYLRLPRQSRTIYAQQKSLHGTTTVQWNEKGITFKSVKGQSSFGWDDFTRIDASNDVILLWQSDAVMNFIPARVLTDDQVMDLASRKRVTF